MNCSEISAVVVTKGDRDISEVLASLDHFGETLIIDNSRQPIDMKVMGRYLGVMRTQFDVVFVCDDDTIVDSVALCAQHEPGKIVCNMPKRWHKAYEGTGISLVGFGAVFDKSIMNQVFKPYADKFPDDEVFLRECDRVFTYLNRDRIVWTEVAIRQLEYSSAPDRMYLQGRTAGDYAEIRRRLATL